MCVCEMWAWYAKWSAVPSRMKTSFVVGRIVAGVQGKKERIQEEERVTDASAHQMEDRNPPFSWPHMQEHASPLYSLLLFFFFCSSFFLLSVTDNVRESAWSLTSMLFETKEEITVSICAYFPLFWMSHSEITLFTPHFCLIIHWCTGRFSKVMHRIHRLIQVALAEFFHKCLAWDSSESKRGSKCLLFFSKNAFLITIKSTVCFVGVGMDVLLPLLP